MLFHPILKRIVQLYSIDLKKLKGKAVKKILFRRDKAVRNARLMLKLLIEHRNNFKKPEKVRDIFSFKPIDVKNPFEFAIGKMYKRIMKKYPNFIHTLPTKSQVKRFRIKVFKLPELYSGRSKSIIEHNNKKDPELHLEKYGNFYLKQLPLEPYLKRDVLWDKSSAYYRGLYKLVDAILWGYNHKIRISIVEKYCRPIIGGMCTVQLLNDYRESF